MNFLQPLILLGLPLMALPVVIHLIHRNRHRTVLWGAMMFLVQAKRMNTGMARLRYLLIMLMRMAAVGLLIFALSRPLASGWLGGGGMARRDATLILLDRSPSMEAQDIQTGDSKRAVGLKKLAGLLAQVGFGNELILMDSATGEPRLVDGPAALSGLPFTEATATSADIPGLLERGLDVLDARESGRADIWMISDLAEGDWDSGSGRWDTIRRKFSEKKGVHLYLLSYAGRPADNLSVTVENVKRRQRGGMGELSLDVVVRGEGVWAAGGGAVRRVPIEIEVEGVRSVVELELEGEGAALKGHIVPVDGGGSAGWGSVTLPGDSNPQDNRFFFAFSAPPVREAVIVSDEARMGRAFLTALEIPVELGVRQGARVVRSDRVGEIDWESTALLIWQAALPQGLVAEQVTRFVESGRTVIFFPPVQPGEGQLFGSKWGAWRQADEEQGKVAWWRGDSDLLAHAGSGVALPLSEMRIYRFCGMEGPGTALARIGGDWPLLARVATDRGGVYFCGTLPTAQFSSMERDGVVFYVMLQRALMDGSGALAAASQRDAGPGALADRAGWTLVAPLRGAPTISERELHAGVYRDGEFWAALNRSPGEDVRGVVPAEAVDGLFAGLNYQRIDDVVGETSSLASEIWRVFLIAMALALLVEAWLCLPEKQVERSRASDFRGAGASLELM